MGQAWADQLGAVCMFVPCVLLEEDPPFCNSNSLRCDEVCTCVLAQTFSCLQYSYSLMLTTLLQCLHDRIAPHNSAV